MNPIEDWISFDVETVGEGENYALQPWRAQFHQARIRTYALSWIKDGKLCHRATDDIDRYKLSQFLTQCAESGKTLVTWKGTFDIAWIVAYGLEEEAYRCKWLDGMILWKNLDRNRILYGLKEAVKVWLPSMAGYEEDVDFEGDIDVLMKYNMDDTDATLLIALKIWNELTPRERNALLIDMEDMVAVAERNVLGIPISLAGLRKTAIKLATQRQENYTKLLPHLENIGQLYARGGVIPNPELKKRFPGFDKLDPQRINKIAHESVINLDSDQQLAVLLFEQWGLPVYKTTPKGAISVDKEVLLETAHLDERASWIQQYRETTGLISKCVKAIAASITYNNPYPGYSCETISRPEQNKSGTVTDRCTYGSYQDPKTKKVKKEIIL